jgi:DNA-directed RNA polymerase specialized sigma24 family protein
MEAPSDQDLLRELMDGSHEAFSIIYQRYWKKVFVFAYDRLKDVKQSQDIVQDIFVSL